MVNISDEKTFAPDGRCHIPALVVNITRRTVKRR